MPWPFLPPNPDTHPAPHDGDLFVFGLTLTGMRPFDEQADHTFSVDGVSAGVYVPVVQDLGSHRYTGVGMAPLTRIGSTATYRGTYVPLGKSNSRDIEVDATQLTGRITNVSAMRSGTKIIFTASLQTGGLTGLSLVAAPFLTRAPKFSSHEAYVVAGGSEPVPAGATTVKVAVTPGSVAQFALFLARGLPGAMEPASAGKLIKP
jgi:hypothetical protein